MDEEITSRIYAFPQAQAHESLQVILQSLAPLRRHLAGESRDHLEQLIRQALRLLPAYSQVPHLSPIEFLLLTFIIALYDSLEDTAARPHPPFP